MRHFILVFINLVTIISIGYGQLPSDYPFKVIVDESGTIYITGEKEGDLTTAKYSAQSLPIWERSYLNIGFDKGMDLTKADDYLYVAGYITNSTSGKFDIVLIKYDTASGSIIWTKTYGDINYNDQAFGIVNDESGDIYICGYETSKKNKNIKIIKSNRFNGDAIWQTSFDGFLQGDDVGTDILIDDYHLYVLGSTYQGSNYDDDVIQLSYRLDNFSHTDTLIYHHKGKEIPTSFIISDFSNNVLQKSRTSMTVITDNIGIPRSKDFLTLTFRGKEFIWKQQFNGNNLDDVPTAIDVYDSSLYVTGFSYRSPMNSDFSTIKYKLFEEGAYGWTDTAVRYFDYRGGKDQGSSVKVKDRDTIYIAGVSELAENGFVIKKYSQTNGGIILAWERLFSPDIDNIQQYATMKKASVLELDGSDNVYQINYFWNDNNKYYSIVKYDANGNQLFVIDNLTDQRDDLNTLKNSENKISKLSNYPNPFNPKTVISYQLAVSSFISLKVYDVLGNEVAILVNERQNAGSYNYQLSTINYQLSSGIYFYSIYANDILVDTKKCLLIK